MIRKEAIPFLLPPLLLFILSFWVQLYPASAVLSLLCLFVLYFFRDPQRRTPRGANLLVSPADGRVVSIKKTVDKRLSKQACTRIDIFMDLWDVHVNRSPAEGILERVEHRPGMHQSADQEGVYEKNEANILLLRNPATRLLLYQIAGIAARRAVVWVKEGDAVAVGQRIGMVKFGSRFVVEVPAHKLRLAVKEGDRVKAGESVLGWIA